MTCRQIDEFLMDYLAGELPEAERQAFDLHVAGCVDCRRYLQSYEQTVRMGRAAFADPEDCAPPAVPRGVIDAILRARAGLED